MDHDVELDCKELGFVGECCEICHDSKVADVRADNSNSKVIVNGHEYDVCCAAKAWRAMYDLRIASFKLKENQHEGS